MSAVHRAGDRATPPSLPLAQAGPQRPRLALTLGDPAGIGPEVVLKALGASAWAEAEITVVGTAAILQQEQERLRQTFAGPLPELEALTLLEVPAPPAAQPLDRWQPGRHSGTASFAFLQAAIAETLAGRFDAIVTAPIAKSAWKAAGHLYPGQTELLAAGAGTDRFAMAFVARSPHTGWTLRSLLATTHIPLQQVPQALTPERLSGQLELLLEWLQQDFGIAAPRLAIAGLNPHSGEQGQLGREEQDWLIAWIERQRQRFPQAQISGPLPPDTMWVAPGQAWFGNGSAAAHDAYLALYHDQGLIPVKLMAFDRAVNTTLGLPFVRTSPDHGTAFDIAGRGLADPTSLIAALNLAIEQTSRRQVSRQQTVA
jgi:4-hydroxythreonine-4-phosphate dehydrogenase